MRRKKLIKTFAISIAIGINSIAASGQVHCELLKKTIYYVSFDLRSKTDYPVQMNGIGTNFKLEQLNIEDKGAFIKSFYREFNYVPNLFDGYRKMLLSCLGDSAAHIYMGKHKLAIQKIQNKINIHSIKKKITLKTGEVVFFNIAMITGKFWHVDVSDTGISTSSSEVDIKTIDEIKDVYVPFIIYDYKRPKSISKLK